MDEEKSYSMADKTIQSFFGTPLSVVNVGLRSFAESLQAQDVPVTQVDWRPPLAPKLQFTRQGVDIEAANTEATRRIMQGRPCWLGWGSPARSSPATTTGSSSTPARLSRGSGCAARSAAR